MPIQLLPCLSTKYLALVVISFCLSSEFDAILVNIALLLLCIGSKTACRNLPVALQSINPYQRDVVICVS